MSVQPIASARSLLQDGPLANWSERYISAYATMHPWEDFAETWAAYLEMVSCLDIGRSMSVSGAKCMLSMLSAMQ